MIQLIASDMDGTLLDARMKISEENRMAIQQAAEQGIIFMVATGRGYTEAKPVLEESGISCPMITVNGAQAFDENGNLLFTIAISKETSAKIIEVLTKHHVYFEVATDHGVFSDNFPQRIENAATMIANKMPHLTYKTAVAMAGTFLESLHIQYVENYQEILNNDNLQILKFIVFSDLGPDALDPIRTELSGLEDIHITSSFFNNIEINHRDATKGAAVTHVAQTLDIPLAQVMTIGDNFNDSSMLEIGGVSFAMGNAEDEVKQIAKYETESNIHHGVGKAIQRAIAENL